MMKRHRQPLEIMASMNITNLLDTAFILLITFMLIAPQLTHGLKIQLPEVEEVPIAERDDRKSVVISIQKKDANEPEERVYFDGKRVDVNDLYDKIIERRASQPDLAVVLEVDEEAASGVFVKAMGAVTRAGIKQLDISALPAGTRSRNKDR